MENLTGHMLGQTSKSQERIPAMTDKIKAGISHETLQELKDAIDTLECWQDEANGMMDALLRLLVEVDRMDVHPIERDSITEDYKTAKRKLIVLYDAACDGTHWLHALLSDTQSLPMAEGVE